MFAHQRANCMIAMGVTSPEGLTLFVNKKFEELDESTQLSFKHLMGKNLELALRK